MALKSGGCVQVTKQSRWRLEQRVAAWLVESGLLPASSSASGHHVKLTITMEAKKKNAVAPPVVISHVLISLTAVLLVSSVLSSLIVRSNEPLTGISTSQAHKW
jgi:hypothetical protein